MRTYIVLLELIEVVDQVSHGQIQVIVQVTLLRPIIVYHFIRESSREWNDKTGRVILGK